ncbi:penicillin-binding protein 2 [Nostocoides sp. F2B08]|uniref:peptidoglycan D,D-transpeptidase FtsI family protein n=1 Tax=Nostocoides sp. F2B08 TaxID=2653936 RepID=UPI00126373CB|nr:penicillin-binding protein 2 [Tetrasphaera sp. F2B08]KAB7745621.1 penicillin-binding protein 2 [Tetrasphaera sp. F2B08]
MNAPIRKLGFVIALLFTTLLVSTTIIQGFQAQAINARPENRRTLLATYGADRGDIVIADTSVAFSRETDNQYQRIRVYPEGPRYAHVTGYFSFLYGAGGGIELAANPLLNGSADQLFYRRISDVIAGQRPSGVNVELTIDPATQIAAEEALGGQKGAAIALDPSTGAILAMVSRPTYDPNVLASHDMAAVQDAWTELNEDPDQPLLNRTISQTYPPGSTFKVVTAAAALSTGRYTLESELDAPDVLDLPQTDADLPNYGGSSCDPSGVQSMIEALAISCNTAFGSLGLELGAEVIREQSARFGIGDTLRVPMNVARSVFPTEELDPPSLAQSAIGQRDVRMTPLQVAMVSAAIANRGIVMQPYLIESVVGNDLSVLETAAPQELSEAVDPEVASQLSLMMQRVVQTGSGQSAQIDGVTVAGKTGTAEVGEGRRAHAWFTGFAPADDPQVAVAVVVENGGDTTSEISGGRVAGPMARQIMEAVVRQ